MSLPWRFMNSGQLPPALNMAIDEAMLESAATALSPTLRFYGWSEPAATFGYFQHYRDVADYTTLRPLIRRPTGGGLVPHDADWTYSLAFPPHSGWYGLSAWQSYERLHQWIAASLASVQVESSLAPTSWKEAPGRCFAGAERFDVLQEGRKIAGAAQRRTRSGLLIQGSIQPTPRGIARGDWEAAVLKTCPDGPIEWSPLRLESFTERAKHLVDTKYDRDEHNKRR